MNCLLIGPRIDQFLLIVLSGLLCCLVCMFGVCGFPNKPYLQFCKIDACSVQNCLVSLLVISGGFCSSKIVIFVKVGQSVYAVDSGGWVCLVNWSSAWNDFTLKFKEMPCYLQSTIYSLWSKYTKNRIRELKKSAVKNWLHPSGCRALCWSTHCMFVPTLHMISID